MVAAAPTMPASAYAARMSHPTDLPPPEAPTRPGWVPRQPVPGPRPAWAVPAALLATAVVYAVAFLLPVVPFWPALAALAAFSWWAAWHPYLPARLRPTWRLGAMAGLSGHPALLLAALVCGAVWARQRQVTGSLVPGIVSHALWALLLLLYVPGNQ